MSRLPISLDGRAPDTALPGGIPRRPPHSRIAELSPGQQRLWVREQLAIGAGGAGGAGGGSVTAAFRLLGPLDRQRLAAGLGVVVERHASLRTTYHLLDGRLIQRIRPRLDPRIATVDFGGLAGPAVEREVQRVTAAAARRPLDLARGPLLRLVLLRLADDEHLALATLHAVTADDWSLDLLVREIALAYGRPADLPALPIQYTDFVEWQRAQLAAGPLAGQLADWRRRLAGAPVLELPADRPRRRLEAGELTPDGAVELPLGDAVVALAEVAAAEGATLFMALLAAFAALLGRLSEQAEVVIGAPVAGRSRAETRQLIGRFANTLPLRLGLAGDPDLRQLISRAREVTFTASAGRDVPFERLGQELAAERGGSGSPLLRAMLSLPEGPAPAVELPGLTVERRELDLCDVGDVGDVGDGTVPCDLVLVLSEAGAGRQSRAVLRYRRDLFDRATVERWGGDLARWIAAAAAAPDLPASQLAPFTLAERRQLERGVEGAAVPRSGAERLVARLFEEVLAVASSWNVEIAGIAGIVGSEDDFFALGGGASQAAALARRLEKKLGEKIWAPALTEASTVARLAAFLAAAYPAAMARVAPEAGAPAGVAAAASPRGLQRRHHTGPPPLSFAQERLWFLDRLEPGSPAYNIPAGVRMVGVLDIAALAASLDEVVRRQAVLRTRFGFEQGRAVQIIDPPAPLALPLIDLSGLSGGGGVGASAAAEAERLAEIEAVLPFDLLQGPLLRAALLRLAADEHLVLFSLHHIAGDAWSVGVLVAELGALYPAFAARRPSPLPELPLQYADFAVWQREQLGSGEGGELERQLSWWRERLAGAPMVLELPADRPRPPVQSLRGATVTVVFPAPLAAGLAALSARGGSGTTLYMTLLAGFQALLGRITGQPTLLVGATIANRTRIEIEMLLGFFINTLVLRADLVAEEGFAAHLGRVRDTTLGAYDHQNLPFELLVEELRPPRDLGRAPLVQVFCQLHNVPVGVLELPGLRLEPVDSDTLTAKFDLVVNLAEVRGALVSTWIYSTDLFDRATVERLAGQLVTLLAAAAADPDRRLGDLPLLSPAERHQLLVEMNPGPRAAAVPELLNWRFAAVAAARPEAVAAVCGSERWTYAELAARAGQLAALLAQAGVAPGDRVGLFLERSLDLVAAVLAVVECGAAYVPIDPAYPAERVAFVLGDSGVRAVVSQQDLEVRLPGLPEGVEIVWVERGGEGVAPLSGEPLTSVRAVPESPAYVIYTSGSTGKPKGVEVAHAQVSRLFDATAEWFGFGSGDVWTLFHSIAFDFSVWELWGPLLSGGRLVVVPYEVSRSPEAFYELLAREGVTVLNQTPSAFRQLIWAEESVRARSLEGAAGELPALELREVIFGGEALELASLAPWVARHGDGLDSSGPRLVNMYGITETTVHVTYRPLSAQEITAGAAGSPIGVPIPDLSVYLVDRGLQPVPLGVPGEMLVGGAGLAQGYLGRPDLTAERFVPDPFSHQPGARQFDPDSRAGARLYRSGDLARWLPSGDLEYLGRIDHQVKIRGFRIELGEIESALAALPGVREAAVLVREEGGEKRLVAYVAAEQAAKAAAAGADGVAALDLATARTLLAATLPDYMLPSALVILPALPLTAHGKIDRRALPAPGIAAPAAERIAPRTALERELAALFGEVLGRGANAGANPEANSNVGAELVSVRVEASSTPTKAAKFAQTAVPGVDGPGVDDDFFELGGSSISGAVLINRLQQRLGEIVHVVAIFDAPTVAKLAAYLATQHRAAVMRLWGPESLGAEARDQEADGEPGAARRIDEAAVVRLRGLIAPPVWSAPSVYRNPRAVFVLSPPRSGSTLLRVMLAGHPALFAPPELELLGFDTLAERSAAFASPRDAFWLEGAVRAVMAARGCSAEDAREALAAAEREGLGTLDFYGRLQSWLGGRTLVDKTPSYALSRAVLERAEAGFEEPFYVHLLRHPLGMAQSFEEAKLDQIFLRRASEGPEGFGRRELAELIWVVSEENITRFLAGVPAGRQHLVRYEDLVREPERVLGELCTALGIPYEPAMARPYEERGDGVRMTDGLHAASRMLGDVKFHQHRGVEASVAERWRESRREDELGEVTLHLARSLGYGESAEVGAGVRIAPGDWQPGQPVPLSFAQERLWFLDRLTPGRSTYNIPLALRLTGTLNRAALADAIHEVVRRHASLRTTFAEAAGQPVQIVAPEAAFGLPVVDLSGLPDGACEAALLDLALAEANGPFDLEQGPLLRATLLALAADDHALLLNLHHIVADGWSLGILVWEATTLYEARRQGRSSPAVNDEQPLPPLRSSTRTMPCGSGGGSRARRWKPRSATGAGRSPARRCSTCRPTGRGRLCSPRMARPWPYSSAPVWWRPCWLRARRAGRRRS